jgi:hypothetical protein
MVVHTCNPIIWQVEAWGSWVWSQSGTQSKIISQKKKKKVIQSISSLWIWPCDFLCPIGILANTMKQRLDMRFSHPSWSPKCKRGHFRSSEISSSCWATPVLKNHQSTQRIWGKKVSYFNLPNLEWFVMEQKLIDTNNNYFLAQYFSIPIVKNL